jgi:hypothetical protein
MKPDTCLLILAMIFALVACASRPPATSSPMTANQGGGTASAAAQTNNVTVPKGYRRVVKDGQEEFCRYDASSSSRVDKIEVCLTEDELLAEQAGDTSATERAHQAAGAGIYGQPSSTGANAPSHQ